MLTFKVSERIRALLRKTALIGSVEALTILISAAAGLLIVNVLPKEDYAFYTVIIACMTMAAGITDMGLVHCTMPIVGQRSNEVYWVLGVSRRVFRRRWALLAAGSVFIVPYWWYLVHQHHWLATDYMAASLVTVGTLMLILHENFLSSMLVILNRVSQLTRPRLYAAIIRGVATCLVLVPFATKSVTLLQLANLLPMVFLVVVYSIYLKNDMRGGQPLTRQERVDVDSSITKMARPLYLSAIFFQFQGIVTIFLVSLFSTTTVLAEVGASGRLAMLLTIVDRVAGILFFPALARLPAGSQLTSMVLRGHAAYLGVLGLALLSAVFLPQYWVLLLGSKYENLEPLLWMVFLTVFFMNGAQFCFLTMASRGHTSRQTATIPAVVSVQIAYLALFGAADLKAVLGFSVATAFVHFAYQYSLLLSRMYKGRYRHDPDADVPAQEPRPALPD